MSGGGDTSFASRGADLIEMGGQDSKVVFLSDPSEPGDDTRDMVDFSVNTNCAAGTGSFLDQQASRLGVSIEGELAIWLCRVRFRRGCGSLQCVR